MLVFRIAQSEMYGSFKICMEQENYIDILNKNNIKNVYIHFRVGLSEINIHRNRIAHSPVALHCPSVKR